MNAAVFCEKDEMNWLMRGTEGERVLSQNASMAAMRICEIGQLTQIDSI
jgi:hypothetical protein